MKIVKNMVFAICLGIFGGLAVTVLSYYNNHKNVGMFDTLFAVSDSMNTIKEAYSDSASKDYDWNIDTDLLAGGRLTSDTGEYIDERIPSLSDSVLAAFRSIGGDSNDSGLLGSDMYGEDMSGQEVVATIGNIFQKGQNDSDVVAVNSGLDMDNPYADIMRFHVRANSDSDEDQELKLAVRDDVITMLKPLVADCDSVAKSKEVIVNNLENIYSTAVNTITEQGYDYPVKVYVTVEEFPAKTYGDLTFPAGKYQALRIDIGNALGQNWWCVMYPPLCFIDDATTVVSDDGKEILRRNLTDEEYRALLNDPSTEIKGESLIYNKIKEWIK